ncbi:MAG: mechanosensitive ion channel family protein [Actinomycetota bacterium]|nr:mechanosensitive ion channel family protein [Actinomycetota bacterium]
MSGTSVAGLSAPWGTAPDPSPSSGIEQAGEAALTAAERFWAWFLGWPLEIILILLAGSLLLFLLRRAIRHVTERIAEGATRASGSGVESKKGRVPRKALIEDALTLANPLANERRAQRARTVGSVLRSTANIVIATVMVLMVLSAVDVNVAPLLASAGVVGVAVGFGAQSLVKDFISGVFLLIEDQFGVGDVVDLGSGAVGTVEEVNLRLTQVRSFDGTLWYVRNGEILRAGNLTQQWSRAVAAVRVPVDADVDVVRAALGRAVDAVQADEEMAQHLLEAPSVRGVDAVTDFSMTFTLHAQVRPASQWEVSRELLRTAQAELRAAGILRSEAVEAEPPAQE